MPVREDSWEKINSGIVFANRHRRTIWMRAASVAAVLFVLLASSAAFWFLSPNEEIEQAFTQLEASNTNVLKGDDVYQSFTPPSFVAAMQKATSPRSSAMSNHFEDQDSVSVSFSFSFSITSSQENSYRSQFPDDYFWRVGLNSNDDSGATSAASTVLSKVDSSNKNKWSAKVYGGVSLAEKKVSTKLPFTLGATVERKLNKYLSVEAGLQYSNVPSANNNLQYIGIPVRLNGTFINTKKVDLYATIGGVADKCIAGAPNNDFKNEPIQLAVTAGVGVNYKINEQLALFVEPGVNHHFKTDSKLETARSKRPTNFNVLCGLRMSF